MKAQKERSEQKLNNLIGKAKGSSMKLDDFDKMQLGLEHEIKCFGKTINELKIQISQL